MAPWRRRNGLRKAPQKGVWSISGTVNRFLEIRIRERFEEVDTMITLAPTAEAIGAPAELRDINDLKSLFNQDNGSPRLILLLSPT